MGQLIIKGIGTGAGKYADIGLSGNASKGDNWVPGTRTSLQFGISMAEGRPFAFGLPAVGSSPWWTISLILIQRSRNLIRGGGRMQRGVNPKLTPKQ